MSDEKSLKRWINSKINSAVINLRTDLLNGLILVELINKIVQESPTFTTIKKGTEPKTYVIKPVYSKPAFRVQMIENVSDALEFLKIILQVNITNISAEDIVEGNVKLILGLLWTLSLYSTSSTLTKVLSNECNSFHKVKSILRGWINGITRKRHGLLDIQNFDRDWSLENKRPDLILASVLEHYLGKKLGFIDYSQLERNGRKLQNISKVFEVARMLGIPQLVDVEDFLRFVPDERCIILYIVEWFKVFEMEDDEDDGEQSIQTSNSAGSESIDIPFILMNDNRTKRRSRAYKMVEAAHRNNYNKNKALPKLPQEVDMAKKSSTLKIKHPKQYSESTSGENDIILDENDLKAARAQKKVKKLKKAGHKKSTVVKGIATIQQVSPVRKITQVQQVKLLPAKQENVPSQQISRQPEVAQPILEPVHINFTQAEPVINNIEPIPREEPKLLDPQAGSLIVSPPMYYKLLDPILPKRKIPSFLDSDLSKESLPSSLLLDPFIVNKKSETSRLLDPTVPNHLQEVNSLLDPILVHDKVQVVKQPISVQPESISQATKQTDPVLVEKKVVSSKLPEPNSPKQPKQAEEVEEVKQVIQSIQSKQVEQIEQIEQIEQVEQVEQAKQVKQVKQVKQPEILEKIEQVKQAEVPDQVTQPIHIKRVEQGAQGYFEPFEFERFDLADQTNANTFQTSSSADTHEKKSYFEPHRSHSVGNKKEITGEGKSSQFKQHIRAPMFKVRRKDLPIPKQGSFQNQVPQIPIEGIDEVNESSNEKHISTIQPRKKIIEANKENKDLEQINTSKQDIHCTDAITNNNLPTEAIVIETKDVVETSKKAEAEDTKSQGVVFKNTDVDSQAESREYAEENNFKQPVNNKGEPRPENEGNANEIRQDQNDDVKLLIQVQGNNLPISLHVENEAVAPTGEESVIVDHHPLKHNSNVAKQVQVLQAKVFEKVQKQVPKKLNFAKLIEKFEQGNESSPVKPIRPIKTFRPAEQKNQLKSDEKLVPPQVKKCLIQQRAKEISSPNVPQGENAERKASIDEPLPKKMDKIEIKLPEPDSSKPNSSRLSEKSDVVSIKKKDSHDTSEQKKDSEEIATEEEIKSGRAGVNPIVNDSNVQESAAINIKQVEPILESVMEHPEKSEPITGPKLPNPNPPQEENSAVILSDFKPSKVSADSKNPYTSIHGVQKAIEVPLGTTAKDDSENEPPINEFKANSKSQNVELIEPKLIKSIENTSSIEHSFDDIAQLKSSDVIPSTKDLSHIEDTSNKFEKVQLNHQIEKIKPTGSGITPETLKEFEQAELEHIKIIERLEYLKKAEEERLVQSDSDKVENVSNDLTKVQDEPEVSDVVETAKPIQNAEPLKPLRLVRKPWTTTKVERLESRKLYTQFEAQYIVESVREIERLQQLIEEVKNVERSEYVNHIQVKAKAKTAFEETKDSTEAPFMKDRLIEHVDELEAAGSTTEEGEALSLANNSVLSLEMTPIKNNANKQKSDPEILNIHAEKLEDTSTLNSADPESDGNLSVEDTISERKLKEPDSESVQEAEISGSKNFTEPIALSLDSTTEPVKRETVKSEQLKELLRKVEQHKRVAQITGDELVDEVPGNDQFSRDTPNESAMEELQEPGTNELHVVNESLFERDNTTEETLETLKLVESEYIDVSSPSVEKEHHYVLENEVDVSKDQIEHVILREEPEIQASQNCENNEAIKQIDESKLVAPLEKLHSNKKEQMLEPKPLSSVEISEIQDRTEDPTNEIEASASVEEPGLSSVKALQLDELKKEINEHQLVAPALESETGKVPQIDELKKQTDKIEPATSKAAELNVNTNDGTDKVAKQPEITEPSIDNKDEVIKQYEEDEPATPLEENYLQTKADSTKKLKSRKEKAEPYTPVKKSKKKAKGKRATNLAKSIKSNKSDKLANSLVSPTESFATIDFDRPLANRTNSSPRIHVPISKQLPLIPTVHVNVSDSGFDLLDGVVIEQVVNVKSSPVQPQIICSLPSRLISTEKFSAQPSPTIQGKCSSVDTLTNLDSSSLPVLDVVESPTPTPSSSKLSKPFSNIISSVNKELRHRLILNGYGHLSEPQTPLSSTSTPTSTFHEPSSPPIELLCKPIRGKNSYNYGYSQLQLKSNSLAYTISRHSQEVSNLIPSFEKDIVQNIIKHLRKCFQLIHNIDGKGAITLTPFDEAINCLKQLQESLIRFDCYKAIIRKDLELALDIRGLEFRLLEFITAMNPTPTSSSTTTPESTAALVSPASNSSTSPDWVSELGLLIEVEEQFSMNALIAICALASEFLEVEENIPEILGKLPANGSNLAYKAKFDLLCGTLETLEDYFDSLEINKFISDLKRKMEKGKLGLQSRSTLPVSFRMKSQDNSFRLELSKSYSDFSIYNSDASASSSLFESH